MRIMIVEDHQPTRDEISAMIQREPGMEVVAEVGTAEDAVGGARETMPDIVVMDILLPGLNGIQATRLIRHEQPEIRILALSNHCGEGLIHAVLRAGALGYVRKSRAFDDLIPALRSVAAGERYVSR